MRREIQMCHSVPKKLDPKKQGSPTETTFTLDGYMMKNIKMERHVEELFVLEILSKKQNTFKIIKNIFSYKIFFIYNGKNIWRKI